MQYVGLLFRHDFQKSVSEEQLVTKLICISYGCIKNVYNKNKLIFSSTQTHLQAYEK